MKKRKLRPWAQITLDILKALAAAAYVVVMTVMLIALGG
jgi:hypothetical protein